MFNKVDPKQQKHRMTFLVMYKNMAKPNFHSYQDLKISEKRRLLYFQKKIFKCQAGTNKKCKNQNV